MDLSHYKEPKPHYYKRICWYIVNISIFRLLPGIKLRYLRNIILKCFGAKIPIKSLVYESAKIWAPWNLTVGKYSCIGPNTQIYNKAPIILGDNVVISQGSFLCTASHDITDPKHSLITSPIIIKDKVWVAADAFIGMGVTINEGAVIGARAAVFKDVESWSVMGGNPARFIKKRIIKS